MAALTVETMSRAGLEPTHTAISASDTFTNDGKKTFIYERNGATAFTLTIVTTQTSDGLAVADRTVSIGANEDHMIGPFPTDVYGTTVTIQHSDVTDGTVAVVKVP